MKTDITVTKLHRTVIMVISTVFIFTVMTGGVAAAEEVYQGEVVSYDNAQVSNGDSYDVVRVTEFTDDNMINETTVIGNAISREGAVYIDTSSLSTNEFYFIKGAEFTPSDYQKRDTVTVKTGESVSLSSDSNTIDNTGSNTETSISVSSNRDDFTGKLSVNNLNTKETIDVITEPYSPSEYSGEAIANHITNPDVKQHVSYDAETKKITVADEFFTTTTPALDSQSLSDIGYGRDVGSYESSFSGAPVAISSNGIEGVYLLDPNYATIRSEFKGIAPDDYTFTIETLQTSVSDTTSISVQTKEINGEFSDSDYETTAGDFETVSFSIENTDTAFIQIGDAEQGYIDVLQVEPSRGDATIKINTRLMGTNAETTEVYKAIDGTIVDSGVHGNLGSNPSSTKIFVNENKEAIDSSADSAFQAYLAELGLISSGTAAPTTQIQRPPQPEIYDVKLSTWNNKGAYESTNGGTPVTKVDTSQLQLSAPTIERTDIYVAPEGKANGEISQQSPIDTARIGDKVIVEQELTGVYGGLSYYSDSFDIRENGDSNEFTSIDSNVFAEYLQQTGEGVTVSFRQSDTTGNQNPPYLVFDNSNIENVEVSYQGNTVRYVINTQTSSMLANGEFESNGEYTATTTFEANGDRYTQSSSTPFDGGGDGDPSVEHYPYITEEISQSDTIEMENQEFSLTNLDENNELTIVIDEETTIEGDTNAAPGTTITANIESTSSTTTYDNTFTTTVTNDGSFEIPIDSTEQNTSVTYETEIQVSENTVNTYETRFSETATEVTRSVSNVTSENETEDESIDTGNTTENTTNTTESTSGETNDGTPGFGVVIAVISIIGAALITRKL